MRILFLCTGNTCRSPMAEVIARAKAAALDLSDLEFRSAGAAAFPDQPASGGALRTAARHGLDLSEHQSTPLDEQLVEWADLILTMSDSHLEVSRALGSDGREVLLAEFAAGSEGRPESRSVPDPIGGDDEVYEQTFATLERLIEASLRRIAEKRYP